MNDVRAFWNSLTTAQRTIVIVAVAALLATVLGSFIAWGTDYSGFGQWLQSWLMAP